LTRARTGIVEFDEMLGGGLMRNDAIMVAGPAGSGKTTLGLAFLVNGITQFGENGLYVTFEELPDQIYRDALNMGWDLRKLEAENKLRIVCTSPNLITAAGKDGSILDDYIQLTNAKRIVVDSLSHLEMFVQEKQFRSEAYRLIMYLKRKGLTSLLAWEAPAMLGQSFGVTDVGLSFLVDSVILFRFVEIDSEMRRAVGIVKMRGSNHDKKLREFTVTSTGIKLASSFAGYEGVITGSPHKSAGENMLEMFQLASKKKK
jgi:circadian clock protein KaiC